MAPINSNIDDWFRKIITLRRQEETMRHSLPAGLERKKWAAALCKQWKILFVQAFFGQPPGDFPLAALALVVQSIIAGH
ncbi:MAG: hypothetical protein ACT4O2_00640 [Beijerinckiaceae bacterium]